MFIHCSLQFGRLAVIAYRSRPSGAFLTQEDVAFGGNAMHIPDLPSLAHDDPLTHGALSSSLPASMAPDPASHTLADRLMQTEIAISSTDHDHGELGFSVRTKPHNPNPKALSSEMFDDHSMETDVDVESDHDHDHDHDEHDDHSHPHAHAHSHGYSHSPAQSHAKSLLPSLSASPTMPIRAQSATHSSVGLAGGVVLGVAPTSRHSKQASLFAALPANERQKLRAKAAHLASPAHPHVSLTPPLAAQSATVNGHSHSPPAASLV